jgi:hypothetical protein
MPARPGARSWRNDLTPSSRRWIGRRYDRWATWNRCSLGSIDGALVLAVGL